MQTNAQMPLWMDNEKLPSFPTLEQDQEADVCIIGAGISGITTAYCLLREKKKIILLERGNVLNGETGRTTAHFVNALDDRYVNLQKYFGEKGAIMGAESHTAAINFVEKLIQKNNIHCDWKRLNGYLFPGPEHDKNFLEKEFTATQKAGLIKTKLLPKIPNFPFDTKPCIIFPDQGELHPVKYIVGLLELIQNLHGKIFTQTAAEKIEEKKDSVTITCENGKKIHAKYAVMATNTSFIHRLKIHTKQAAYRTYVVAWKIKKNTIPKGLFWDTHDPYHYIRTYEEDKKSYLIIGGEDHKTGQKKNPEECFKKLISWTEKRFPKIGEIAYQWSGQIMEPVDGLAFLGLHPENKRIFVITGDSGNGMTHGTIGAMLITDLIMQRKNPWAKLYDPARKPIKAAKEFLRENANVPKYYGELLTPGEKPDEKNLAKKSGAIIRKGPKKIAVYCDAKGKIHQYSAICTHLGCIVHWNGTEKTWDCPCHGSRFNAFGKVINGPAAKNLEKI